MNLGLQQYILERTRITSTSATLLNHVYSNSYYVTCTGTFEPGIAEHRAVYCCLSKANLYTQKPLQKHKCMNFRSIKKVFEEELDIAFESIDGSKALDCMSVDDAAAVFVKLFTSAWDSIAPSRLRRTRAKAHPWMTEMVLNLIYERQDTYKKFLSTRNSANEQLFK